MKSWVYMQGYEKGFQEGLVKGQRLALAMMVHWAERRLPCPLSAEERSILLCHLGVLTDERICEMLFDSSPEALVAWLTGPDVS